MIKEVHVFGARHLDSNDYSVVIDFLIGHGRREFEYLAAPHMWWDVPDIAAANKLSQIYIENVMKQVWSKD